MDACIINESIRDFCNILIPNNYLFFAIIISLVKMMFPPYIMDNHQLMVLVKELEFLLMEISFTMPFGQANILQMDVTYQFRYTRLDNICICTHLEICTIFYPGYLIRMVVQLMVIIQ